MINELPGQRNDLNINQGIQHTCKMLGYAFYWRGTSQRVVRIISIHKFTVGYRYLPILTTGHDFLHSCLHFLGLHLSLLTIAILVNLSCDILHLKCELKDF